MLTLSKKAAAQREEEQNACAKTLGNARNTYEQGKIEMIPDMLSECLKNNGFTRSEKSEAYKLLILSFLYFNERAQAESVMQQFLHLNPEYEINSVVDPPEFINLYKTFRTTPVLMVGGIAGGNLSFVKVMKNYALDNIEQSLGKYTSKTGYQLNLLIDKPISRRVSISSGLSYLNYSYEYSKNQFGYSYLLFIEDQKVLEIPILAKYYFSNKNVRPYLQAGVAVSYLLLSDAIITRLDSVNAEVGNRTVSGPSIDIKSHRAALNYKAVIGAGVLWKNVIGNGFLMADVKYGYSLNNTVQGQERYTNPDLVYKYLYVDNDMILNNLSFSIGYILPIYNPKVIKSKEKTKSLK